MKNLMVVSATLIVLGLANWGGAVLLQLAFLDIAIPFAALALGIVYFFKSKGGMASRHLDMSIQGQTGIRMERQVYVPERSYVFIGAILYFVLSLGITLFIYREYVWM